MITIEINTFINKVVMLHSEISISI